MTEDFIDGEIVVVAVYLDEPQDGNPTGEPVDLSFFLTTEEGVTQLDRVVEEPYLIDWMDSKMMRLADVLGRRLIYEADDGMSCDIEQDILPVEAPEVVYAMLGRLRQVEPTPRQGDGDRRRRRHNRRFRHESGKAVAAQSPYSPWNSPEGPQHLSSP